MKIEKVQTLLLSYTLPELHAAYVALTGDRLGQALVLDEIQNKAPALYARHYDEDEYDLDIPGLLAEIEGGYENEK